MAGHHILRENFELRKIFEIEKIFLQEKNSEINHHIRKESLDRRPRMWAKKISEVKKTIHQENLSRSNIKKIPDNTLASIRL